nr:sulfite exporter TauE/SafE family protein [Fundidesulfovibrio agrisoli]
MAGIAALAGFTQGFAGFGSTLVAMPLLVAMLGVRTAVPVGCLMAVTINVMLTQRLRHHIQGGAVRRLLLGAVPGMAVGGLMLRDAPDSALKALLGATILALTAQSLRPPRCDGPPRKGWATVAGLVSGCMGVSIGVNGPPIVAWVACQPWGRDAARATLTTYFLLAGIGAVGVQGLQGLVTPPVLAMYAWSMPALALGLYSGAALCGRVGDKAFRRVLLALLAASGLAMLWQGGVALLLAQ